MTTAATRMAVIPVEIDSPLGLASLALGQTLTRYIKSPIPWKMTMAAASTA